MGTIADKLDKPTSSGLVDAKVEDIALFPTQVRILRWKTDAGFNERLSEICSVLYEENIGRKRSYLEYNLWQYDHPEIAELGRMFAQGMRGYIETCMNPGIARTHDYQMRGWIRINNPSEVISPHSHPGVHVVGTYYSRVDIAGHKPGAHSDYSTDHRAGDLVMLDPRSGVKLSYEKPGKGSHAVTPEAGMMVLMPCYLCHWVNPVVSGDSRVCIANNMTLVPKTSLQVRSSFQD